MSNKGLMSTFFCEASGAGHPAVIGCCTPRKGSVSLRAVLWRTYSPLSCSSVCGKLSIIETNDSLVASCNTAARSLVATSEVREERKKQQLFFN